MIEAAGYGVILALAVTMAWRSGSRGLRRTATAVAVNWLLVMAAQAVTQSYAPWFMFVAIDACTAFFVLQHPASKAQAAIGAIYVLQIIIHVAFGTAGPYHDAKFYLAVLTFGGACQLLILATGAIHHGRGRKMASFRSGGGNHSRAAGAYLSGMDEGP